MSSRRPDYLAGLECFDVPKTIQDNSTADNNSNTHNDLRNHCQHTDLRNTVQHGAALHDTVDNKTQDDESGIFL